MIHSPVDVKLPYISADVPGIGGALRAIPEHFVVEEVALYEPEGEGQHLYINLTKVELTTKEVQQQLAKLFQIDRNSIGFAGMKDKFASTTQTFSLSLGHISTDEVDQAAKRIQDELPVTVHWAKRHKNKLKTGHLLGNRFRIVITNLSQPLAKAQTNAQAIATQLSQTGLPNYFGPQRFGINGENVARGYDLLVNGRFIRDRWLRRFLVSSYQSYLCNRYLSERVQMGAFQHLLAGDIAKKYETGGIFTVEHLADEQPRYEEYEISFTAPLYGTKMRAAADESGDFEAKILAESGVTDSQWKKAKVDGSRRLGRLLVSDLAIKTSCEEKTIQPQQGKDDEDSLTIEFFLPKGAFATTVLREFMKNDLSNIPETD
ncbi:MAG: tRNA pseudouridine(13) synthase TruD [Chloroflexota bacterium]